MSITRLSGGLTPADGADPRTFPTIFNDAADLVEQNESDITSLDGRVTTNEGDITALDGRVTTNEGDISSIDGRVTVNEGDITALDGRVTTNEGDITALDGRVTTNEGDILALDNRVTVNEGDIVDLQDDSVRTVEHGSTAGTARPSVKTVYWKGSVAPDNGANGDLWYDTSGD